MAKKIEKKKIHVERLMEDANTWWDELGGERENIVLREYMKAKHITSDDVDW